MKMTDNDWRESMRYITKQKRRVHMQQKQVNGRTVSPMKTGGSACFSWLFSFFKRTGSAQAVGNVSRGCDNAENMAAITPVPRRRRKALGGMDTDTVGLGIDVAQSLCDLRELCVVEEEAIEDINALKGGFFSDYIKSRQDYALSIKKGRLYYQGELFNTRENGRFKFVQDRNGDIYGAETSADPDGIKHSSLIGREWPVSAGTMSARNGMLLSISSASGHFRPPRVHLDATVNYLKKKGVKIDEVCPFFGEDNVKRLNLRSPACLRCRLNC